MTHCVHLYDPTTQIHYANGGFIAANHPVPADGFEWVPGKAPQGSPTYEPLTVQAQVTAIVEGLPMESRANHYVAINTLMLSLTSNDAAMAAYIANNQLSAQTPDETTAFDAIQDLLAA